MHELCDSMQLRKGRARDVAVLLALKTAWRRVADNTALSFCPFPSHSVYVLIRFYTDQSSRDGALDENITRGDASATWQPAGSSKRAVVLMQ